MTQNSMITVKLSREYEFTVEEIRSILRERDAEEHEIDEALIRATAQQVAMDIFAEEMIYFESSVNDFVSAHTIIN